MSGGNWWTEGGDEPRSELNVVIALDDVDVQLLATWGRECSLLNTELVEKYISLRLLEPGTWVECAFQGEASIHEEDL
jgi:hypothetical protein